MPFSEDMDTIVVTTAKRPPSSGHHVMSGYKCNQIIMFRMLTYPHLEDYKPFWPLHLKKNELKKLQERAT